MKRLISAALAFSLIGATALQAEPYRYSGGNHGFYGHHDRYDRGRDFDRHHDRHHDNGAGTAIAVGVGLIALTAILASQADRERARDADYDRYDPPPPPRNDDHRYGYPGDRYEPADPDGPRDNGPYER